ncbi:MAG TPA: phage baseplate assembly protein V [Polaromonas sp.]|uniref:phage baseplate assembly protein V n=1 Tax=Polaromonas sp. TaxID=1869339 RepID=UPI002D57F287|nr:phage baseplate assembly protein V [Polaromonas sp.]HYW57671.1 phage baseplate assembly protein V [Polaromonas sp.]
MSADRIAGVIRRVFRRSLDSSTPNVQVQVESLAEEAHSDVEVMETYGDTAVPPDDVQEGLAAFVAGESDHGVVLGWFDKTHRPTDLLPGEVVKYSVFGQRIKFDALGQVLITSGSGSTIQMLANGDIVSTPSSGVMKVTGALQVSGNISSGGTISALIDVVAQAISLVTHRHSGVDPGAGNSGGPI